MMMRVCVCVCEKGNFYIIKNIKPLKIYMKQLYTFSYVHCIYTGNVEFLYVRQIRDTIKLYIRIVNIPYRAQGLVHKQIFKNLS